jgi:hypothetical protein
VTPKIVIAIRKICRIAFSPAFASPPRCKTTRETSKMNMKFRKGAAREPQCSGGYEDAFPPSVPASATDGQNRADIPV